VLNKAALVAVWKIAARAPTGVIHAQKYGPPAPSPATAVR
jgi:hypothetical protein